MDKKQAQEEYLKILSETIAEEDRIIREAQENGTWKSGLDSNRDLFVDVEKKFDEKIKLLQSMID